MSFQLSSFSLKNTGLIPGFWVGGAADSAEIRRRLVKERVASLQARMAKCCKSKEPIRARAVVFDVKKMETHPAAAAGHQQVIVSER